MALTSLKTPAAATKAKEFVSGGVTTITAPRAKVRKFDTEEHETYLKLMLFGNPGTGKTYIIRAMLELGLKVFVLTTDVGGDGLNAVIIPMRLAGTWEKWRHNLRSIELSGYENVKDFFANPSKYEGAEDIYDWDPDFVFWDGFSGFQQVDLSEYVGDFAGGKSATDAMDAGLQFDQQKWGHIRNGTIRALDAFCSLRNAKTGRMWNKALTCHEAVKSKGADAGGGFKEGLEPLLQGAGGRLALGAFDIVLRTTTSSSPLDEDGSQRQFNYILQGHQNLAAKVRGFSIPPKMAADGKVLLTTLYTQLGVDLPKLEA